MKNCRPGRNRSLLLCLLLFSSCTSAQGEPENQPAFGRPNVFDDFGEVADYSGDCAQVFDEDGLPVLTTAMYCPAVGGSKLWGTPNLTVLGQDALGLLYVDTLGDAESIEVSLVDGRPLAWMGPDGGLLVLDFEVPEVFVALGGELQCVFRLLENGTVLPDCFGQRPLGDF